MFLIDKYNYLLYQLYLQYPIINKILASCNNHNYIYNNINEIIKKPLNEFIYIIKDLERCVYNYSNFQHLIIYGSINTNKDIIVNIILEKIYGKYNIELKDIEYIINGYSNTKTKVNIKQSKYHMVIEPNNNGFDKYVIQEIIQYYAKTELLNILKYKKLFKVIVINKLDNLSYYAQASLRRTMEKYSDSCKFIFICDQLSKIIEPIRSRCILIRSKLPTYSQILEILINIAAKEQINLSLNDYNTIIHKSEYNINTAIWILELNKYKLSYNKKWEIVSKKIVSIILNKNNYNNSKCLTSIKKIRKLFYNLFITNIPTTVIINNIMMILLNNINNLQLSIYIIEIISTIELKLSSGTRNCIHFECCIINLIYLFNMYYNNNIDKYNLYLSYYNL